MEEAHDLEKLEQAAAGGDAEAAEELGLALLAGAEPDSERFALGLRWLGKAAESGRPSAILARGHVHLQHPTLDEAPDIARRCYEDAARAGDPHAVERLADLYLFGYGVERSQQKAFSLYRQLAGYGFPSVLCQAAYLWSEGIGCERDETEAATLVLQAAAQGHTLAFALASLRYRDGFGVPEDPTVAAAWMELAAARGFPSAEGQWQEMLEQLDEHSRNRARELAESIKGNLQALGQQLRSLPVDEGHPDYPARFNELVAENYAQLNISELDLDPSVRGAAVRRRPERGLRQEVCCWSPRVFRIPDFATPEERAFLLDAAQPLLKSTAQVRGAQRAVEVDAFDGECAIFAPYLASPVVRNLVDRFARITHIPAQHFEPMSVLRYCVGHEYSPHVDFFDGARMERHYRAGDRGGQRLVTTLIHLIAAQGGGETHYPAANTTVAATPGTAVIHYNATPDGLGDPDSLHQGRPITAGEKWLARSAARENSLYGEFFETL